MERRKRKEIGNKDEKRDHVDNVRIRDCRDKREK